MKIEELHDAFNGKTQLQVKAILPNYLGKEILIEGPIYDVREYIIIFDSTNKCHHIRYDSEKFSIELLDYSKGMNTVIKAKLDNVSFPSNDPNLSLSLIAITKA